MKKFLVAISVPMAAALLALPAVAEDNPKHGSMQNSVATASPSMVDGIVKKIDKSSGKVTIAHGPMANFNMPAMTMAFQVKDSAWLDQMKDGDTIRFMADKLNGAFTIIKFEQSAR